MKFKNFIVSVLFGLLPAFCLSQTSEKTLQTTQYQGFTLHCSTEDTAVLPAVGRLVERGQKQIESFFGRPFPQRFEVWIYPDRAMLDRRWQEDWKDTSFHSACWMVASGVGAKLDLLSPRVWSEQACEHTYSDTAAVYKLLAHELVHVYHGQFCRKPDFEGMDVLGWWVEGLATLASGQLDSARLARVRTLVRAGKAPAHLADFWSGPNRYGLAGSVIASLDAAQGRKTMFSLLPLTTDAELFEALKADEPGILAAWRRYLGFD